MPRFAANLSTMYGEYPFLQRFAAAAEDGFKAVEVLFPYEYAARDLQHCLAASGLTQVLINAPPGNFAAGERGMAAVPGKEADFRSGMHTAFAYAQSLRCSRIHVMAGLQTEGVERAAMRQTFVANLTWAATLAASQGIELLIEPINTGDMPCYFLNRQAEAHAIVEQVGSPALKVQMDLYHCHIMEGDVSKELRRYLHPGQNRVGHIQIAGVPGRNEPDQGAINYPEIFKLMDDLGYEGWVGCEYKPRGKTSQGLSWLPKLWT